MEVLVRRKLRRSEMRAFFAKQPPCLVGIEACASAHYWARELSQLGHTVRLMPATYAKAYVKRGKSDAIDAEAICEAVTRPTMHVLGKVKTDRRRVHGDGSVLRLTVASFVLFPSRGSGRRPSHQFWTNRVVIPSSECS